MIIFELMNELKEWNTGSIPVRATTDKFNSHFMNDYLAGKLKAKETNDLFSTKEKNETAPLVFSMLNFYPNF
ncbi:MAG: hypothetical protein J0L69_13305 [Bacteroidetes bacterium]|nr:hypothetical protein [Bacteroidota bacterium]